MPMHKRFFWLSALCLLPSALFSKEPHELKIYCLSPTTASRHLGGGTKDPLWLQICSDVTGMPQEVPEQTLGAAYGDAYLAGCAAGLFKDSTPLRKWVKISRTVKPDPAKKPLYDQLYGLYCELYANTRELMHRVARLGVDG